jgi:hypothetical protein
MKLDVIVVDCKEDKSVIYKKEKCKITKRLLLIFTLLPIITAIPYKPLEWSRSLYYLVPASGLTTFILLINFPQIVKKIHGKPLYYEDLVDEKYIDPLIKRHFQIIFICILQITLTLIMTGLIYYYYDRLHNTELSKMEILGVLGGFISLLMKIENFIGNCILSLLNICKDKSTTFDKNKLKLRANSLDYLAN